MDPPYHDVLSGEEPDTEAQGPRSLQVLCVEDNEGDFILLREHLRDASRTLPMELSWATTLHDAFELLEPERLAMEDGPGLFDVILLDLSLPDSKGPDTLDQVTEVAKRTPVIVLSGNEDHELAVSLVKRGAQDYLPKAAIQPDLLARSILYAVERQRSRSHMAMLNARLEKATHDLKTAQMHLIHAEKLDSLGRLAAGVAHEVKNPLATLQMGVDFFRRQVDVMGDPAGIIVRNMEEAINSADRIIQGMVDYSRSDALKMQFGNVNVLVRRALGMIQHEVLESKVTVEEDLCEPIPAARIDPGKIEQVLINVLMNAIQAMADQADDRILEVRTFWGQLESIGRDFGLRHYERLRALDHAVVVEVRDHGPGVPEDKLTRIFEPFYTTKPTGQGTGLGLSVAKSIVDLHRGHFEVKNLENPRGLRVRIFLMAYELNAEQQKEFDAQEARSDA